MCQYQRSWRQFSSFDYKLLLYQAGLVYLTSDELA